MNERNLRELNKLEKDKIADKAILEKQKKIIAESLMSSDIRSELEKKEEEPKGLKKILLKLLKVCS